MLASSKCVVFGEAHYLFLSGHIHRVLNTNSPVPGADSRATLCEVANEDHTVSVPRALVLNLPSPSPLITYEFLVLNRGAPADASPLLFCTGVMFRPRELNLKTFGQVLFTCGPGTVAGNREQVDVHLKTIRALATISVKAATDASSDDSEFDTRVLVDAKFFERLLTRVVPSNPIGVWIETIAFRHYFLTENVLRAMCYASNTQSALMRGHEQVFQNFMTRLERTDKHVDRAILSHFYTLNDPTKTFNDALSSDLCVTPVASAVLQCFPRIVGVGDGSLPSSKKCASKHDSTGVPDRTFLNVYTHLVSAMNMLELLKKRYDSENDMHVNCADDKHAAEVVQHLRELGCVSRQKQDKQPVKDHGGSGPIWVKLEWPRVPPVPLDRMPLADFTTTVSKEKFAYNDLIKFYDEAYNMSWRSRRRNASQWLQQDLDERAKTEKSALVFLCFSVEGALFLHSVSAKFAETYGEDSVVVLCQPETSREIARVLSEHVWERTIVGCVMYGGHQELTTDNLSRLEEAYTDYCGLTRVVPRVLKIT